MARTVSVGIEFAPTDQGLSIGDLTFDVCETFAGVAVSSVGATLLEDNFAGLGAGNGDGCYTLSLSVDEDTKFRVHITADPTKFATGYFPYVAGIEARETTLTTLTSTIGTLDGKADSILTETQSHPTLAEMLAGGLALEASSQSILTALGAGAGNAVTIQLYVTATTDPIPDAYVSVYNSNETVFLTAKTTDSNGRIVIALPNGTYKLRSAATGYSFAIPETLTVSGSATHIFYGTGGVTLPELPPAGLQNLYGNVRQKTDWTLAVGVAVSAKISEREAIVQDALMQYIVDETVTDANGQFLLVVPCGAKITVTIADHGSHTFIVSQVSGNVDIATYLVA